jgi:argininosuccinate lyase
MSGKRLWGGRFSSQEDPFFSEFNDSLPFDRVLLEADVEGSRAYANALRRADVLNAAEHRLIQRGLREILSHHLAHPEEIARSGAEDVHTYVEQALTERIGEAALKLHTGRSRNDQVATDLRLHLRRQAVVLESELTRLLEDLAALAEDNPEVVMPGYTHLQRAQPVLFSHYLLAYGEMFLRDLERLRQSAERASVCPLGSGALSGTVYRVDREALARDLGFSAVSENSMDAVADRDFVLDFLYAAAVLMMHLSRLSEDLILYSSSEFGFVSLHDSVASGSSLMPQKKNPDSLELIRGKTGRVYGHLVSLLTVTKGLPMTYDKDLQEDKEGVFDSLQTAANCMRMMQRVLERMEVRPAAMRAAAVSGYLNATELADYLVARGMPFRDAHRLVGRIVVRALELGVPLERLDIEEYGKFSPLFSEDLYGWLPPEKAISRRAEKGGTSASAVRRALARFRKRAGITKR